MERLKYYFLEFALLTRIASGGLGQSIVRPFTFVRFE